MRKIVVVDPGETCGVVEFESVSHIHDLNDPPAILDVPDLSIARYEANNDDWDVWIKLVKTSDAVICEDFRLYQGKSRHLTGDSLRTVRLIGALEVLCYVNDVRFILQQPSIMTAYPDQRLRSLGLWHKSKHVRSATVHMLWALFRGHDPVGRFYDRE